MLGLHLRRAHLPRPLLQPQLRHQPPHQRRLLPPLPSVPSWVAPSADSPSLHLLASEFFSCCFEPSGTDILEPSSLDLTSLPNHRLLATTKQQRIQTLRSLLFRLCQSMPCPQVWPFH